MVQEIVSVRVSRSTQETPCLVQHALTLMQKLISSTDRYDFDKKVNELLEEGAKVVPGTLTCALSSSAATAGSAEYMRTEHDHEERWAVILELA